VAIYYVNFENKIIAKSNKRFYSTKSMVGGKSSGWGQLEEEKFIEIAKKTLGGQLGKGLVEYYFPNEFLLDKSGNYKKLYDLNGDCLETKEIVDNFVDLLINTLSYNKDYAIVLTACSYMVPTKDINGDKVDIEEEFGDSYDFTVVSFCDIVSSNLGLFYDNKKKEIHHSEQNEKVIGMPFSGFLFPTFNDRQTDVNSVLVYNKKPKEPDTVLIESVLGCEFEFDPVQERDKFNTLITKIITKTDDSNVPIDLSSTTKIYEQINNVINDNVLETELPTLTANDIKKILKNAGVKEENLENFDDVFKQEMGNEKVKLKAVNLVDANKMDIKSPDISISVKNDQTDKIKPISKDGRRYLMIELDDTVDVNGLKVNIK
jgi:hypothetical protein